MKIICDNGIYVQKKDIAFVINNTENVPEYSEKQKKQYSDAIKAYEHIGNGVSWSQFEWKTYDTQMTVTFEDSVKVESISKGMNVING